MIFHNDNNALWMLEALVGVINVDGNCRLFFWNQISNFIRKVSWWLKLKKTCEDAFCIFTSCIPHLHWLMVFLWNCLPSFSSSGGNVIESLSFDEISHFKYLFHVSRKIIWMNLLFLVIKLAFLASLEF